MSEDSLFRNATIGGFNKEDVMRYIELLKKTAVENEVQLDRATKQLAETERRATVAENNLEKEKFNGARLAKEYEKLEERVKEAEAKSAALAKRLSSYENSKSKLAAIEVQLGALMVDAHMYADKIVETAKQEAKRISEETRQIVSQAKEEISALSTDFISTSEEYGRLLSIINSKISDLPTQFDAISDSVKNDYDSLQFEAELEDIPMPEIDTILVEEPVNQEEAAEKPEVAVEEEMKAESEIKVEPVAEQSASVVEPIIEQSAPVFEPMAEQPAPAEKVTSEEKSIEEEAMAKLDELFANVDAVPADLPVNDAPAEEKAKAVKEEPFSMSSFFSDIMSEEELKTEEPSPVQESSDSSDDAFDYTKFLDFLSDDSSN